MKVLLLLALFSVTSCASFDKMFSFSEPRHIKCYSGKALIYEGTSEGKVYSESSSDGYIFNELKSGKLVEVSGNCIMRSL